MRDAEHGTHIAQRQPLIAQHPRGDADLTSRTSPRFSLLLASLLGRGKMLGHLGREVVAKLDSEIFGPQDVAEMEVAMQEGTFEFGWICCQDRAELSYACATAT